MSVGAGGAGADVVVGDRKPLQRKVIRTLVMSQVLAGLGMASGLSVGVLLAENLSGAASLAGLGSTAQVLGGALITVPVARIMAARGRRVGLQLGYLLALVGAALVVTAAVVGSFALFIAGMLLLGGGTTSNGQARYAAADLAADEHRGRDLSIVVWATTIGSVLGPNLVGPGKAFARVIGVPDLAGSFVFSMVGFVLAFLVINRLLRPDPLLTSRALDLADARAARGRHTATPDLVPEKVTSPTHGAGERAAALEPVDGLGGDVDHSGACECLDDVPDEDPAADHDGSVSRGLRVVRSNVGAFVGMLTTALGHVVMVSVMVMTPVHMEDGHAELEVIGFVISMHILGMFALSPVIGWAVDRWGARPIAALGGGILTTAALLASRSQDGWSGLLLLALFLLGLGWSCTLVSGSTMLTASITVAERPATQGVSDVVMGLMGALGGACAGFVVGAFGYSTLAAGAAVVGGIIIALVALSRGPRRQPAPDLA